MAGKQQINCSVCSCAYNNEQQCKCMLKTIDVKPQPNKNTKQCDESMCSCYQFDGEKNSQQQ